MSAISCWTLLRPMRQAIFQIASGMEMGLGLLLSFFFNAMSRFWRMSPLMKALHCSYLELFYKE